MKNSFQIIAFDADDTLWVNEPYYRETEKKFYQLMADYIPENKLTEEFYKTEVGNLPLYGYGAKGHTLSMIETALRVSNNKVTNQTIQAIIDFGKELINKPVVLLNGVEKVLQALHEKDKKLIVVTKGDLLDQERKLANSGLKKYFHHIEIVSDKNQSDYLKLLEKLNVPPEKFLMIGNSRKSDIIPVVAIGGYAIYVPYHTSWQHEEATKIESNHCIEVENINEVLTHLKISY
jgi:putative hydrolase of the HAD superfamily